MPEAVIEQSSEYKQLLTKYSLVVNDNMKLKHSLDESKSLLEGSRTTFQRQLEQMESDELNQQKKLGNEMMQLEEQLTQFRKENELLRIEYEQNVAANEQTGPINKEMRSLITTLQTNNKLLKSDNIRTKKRLEDLTQEADKLRKQLQQLQLKAESHVKAEPLGDEIKNEAIKREDDSAKEIQIKELKEENKKLLEVYNKSSRQQQQHQSPASGCSTAASSSKHKMCELEEARLEIKRLRESLDRYKSTPNKTNIPIQQQAMSPSHHHHHHHHHHQTDEQHSGGSSSSTTSSSLVNDYIKKIKSLDETIRELHKSLSSKKQEETALLNDMEITGQAFEDMQVS